MIIITILIIIIIIIIIIKRFSRGHSFDNPIFNKGL
mgnify:CR=1 FL=1